MNSLIKALRERGTKIDELANHLGMSSQTVRSHLRKEKPSIEVAAAVAKVLEKSVQDIFPALGHEDYPATDPISINPNHAPYALP